VAQREINFDRLDQLVTELKRRGITKIVFAEINEKRALQTGPEKLEVTDLKQLEILAYRDSTIFKCRIPNADFVKLHDALAEDGFEITRRSRNIT
jgi:hypothetical protein